MLESPEVQQLLQLNHMDMDTLLQALVPNAAKLALPYISGFYVGYAHDCVAFQCNR